MDSSLQHNSCSYKHLETAVPWPRCSHLSSTSSCNCILPQVSSSVYGDQSYWLVCGCKRNTSCSHRGKVHLASSNRAWGHLNQVILTQEHSLWGQCLHQFEILNLPSFVEYFIQWVYHWPHITTQVTIAFIICTTRLSTKIQC